MSCEVLAIVNHLLERLEFSDKHFEGALKGSFHKYPLVLRAAFSQLMDRQSGYLRLYPLAYIAETRLILTPYWSKD
jgi:hypothetical protein